MKTHLLFFMLLICGISFGQAQIENSGFEGAWEDVTGSEDEPEEWSSLKTADALGFVAPIVLFQSTDAHTGTYSARLKNTTAGGIVANGIMTNGQVHADFDPEEGYVFTNTDNSDWYYSFTDRPDSLVAWVKYNPEGGDRGKLEILLHTSGAEGKLPEAGSTSHWVAKARIDVEGSISEWTRVSAPFNYFSGDNPTYALMVVTSGDSTIAVDGSEMWIDDIELIYNPFGTGVEENENEISVFTSGSDLIINTESAQNGTVRLFGLDGRLVLEEQLNGTNNRFGLKSKGVFLYQIEINGTIQIGKVTFVN